MKEAKRQKRSSGQKKMLAGWLIFIIGVAALFLSVTCLYLAADKENEDENWDAYLTESDTYTDEELAAQEQAVQVSTGVYIERLDDVDFKNSSYTVTFRCWFNWEGHDELDMTDGFELYEGTITSLEKKAEHREDGSNYQMFLVTAQMSREFSTRRFPLGSYQLRLYLKPTKTIDEVVLVPDTSGSSVNDKLNAAGFCLTRSETGLFVYRCEKDTDGAYYKGSGSESYSEILTAIELNRDSIGLYVKCCIALLGSGVWALITLYVCTHHQVDTLWMLPPILIGTVTNLMIGADLVPDALDTGLLEFINIWGIYLVLLTAVLVAVINRIRVRDHDEAFAELFGRVMFWTVFVTMLIGHVVLPLSAYKLS